MKKRVISALLACIICIPVLIIGGWPFKIGISVLSILGLYEILKVSSDKIKIPEYVKLLAYIIIALFIMLDLSMIVKILSVFLIFGIIMIFIDNEKYNVESFFYLFSSIIFLGVVFSFIISIRENDINILLFLLLITILTDTFAYIVGKTIGKHKLIPKVSPGKTIEGSVGGTIVGTLVPSIFYIYMVDPGANFIFVLLFVFVLSALGQLGDLFFSKIKRFYSVKDFSNIMPGHGGILDRVDSIIFVVIGYIILESLI